MRYWAILAAKLIAAAVLIGGALALLQSVYPRRTASLLSQPEPFAHDLLYTSATMLFWLFCVGLMYLVIRDQRYRCRSCGRRLRMPIAAGSWPNMFLIGRPRTEYICVYGHGTLRVPEEQIPDTGRPRWQANDDRREKPDSFEEPTRCE